MAETAGLPSARRKARAPRAARKASGRQKGLFPRLDPRPSPYRVPDSGARGAPERLPQGRRAWSTEGRVPAAVAPSGKDLRPDPRLYTLAFRDCSRMGSAPLSEGKGSGGPGSRELGSPEWASDQGSVGRPWAAAFEPSAGLPSRTAALVPRFPGVSENLLPLTWELIFGGRREVFPKSTQISDFKDCLTLQLCYKRKIQPRKRHMLTRNNLGIINLQK